MPDLVGRNGIGASFLALALAAGCHRTSAPTQAVGASPTPPLHLRNARAVTDVANDRRASNDAPAGARGERPMAPSNVMHFGDNYGMHTVPAGETHVFVSNHGMIDVQTGGFAEVGENFGHVRGRARVATNHGVTDVETGSGGPSARTTTTVSEQSTANVQVIDGRARLTLTGTGAQVSHDGRRYTRAANGNLVVDGSELPQSSGREIIVENGEIRIDGRVVRPR